MRLPGFKLMYKCSSLRNLLAENDHIDSVCFSPDGRCLATGSEDGYIYVRLLSSDFCL
jgi:WD40 repeat protein